ncbi:MAG: preprotein translocase subunit SecE [Bacillota bacterium]|nr:preprotein translocase subunit SecE [Bacillota bacterium]
MAVKKAAQVQQEPGIVEKGKKFFRNVLAELKKVHWPNRPQLIAYTGVVLGAVVLVSALIWLMDSVLSGLLSLII